MGYSDAQILELLKKVNELKPYGFSIVDKEGSFQQVAVMGLSANRFAGCASVAAGVGADGRHHLLRVLVKTQQQDRKSVV